MRSKARVVTSDNPEYSREIHVPQHFGKLSASHSNEMSGTWYVYMLLCDQKTFYVGISNDIKKRLLSHKNKDSFFTKQFSDVTPVYLEKYFSKREAALREKQLKGWSHAKKQMLIDGKLGINSTEIAEVLGD